MKTRAGLALAGLAALTLALVQGCSGDDPASPGDTVPDDTTPPSVVTDLRTESVSDALLVLAWTAPGDDGDQGTATEYDIRSSTSPINWSSWDACTALATVPTPAVAGTKQTVELPSPAHPDCYIALKAVDDASNWSDHSNVVHVSFGSTLEIHQLTTEGNNIQPCLNQGIVTWVRTNSVTGDEIYIANVIVAQPAPARLTDNAGEKAYPSSHGSEKITWQGRQSGSDDWEVFTYDKYAIPRYSAFTDNDIPDRNPVLAGGGDFAWLQGATMFEEIHYWDEPSRNESVISSSCCPINEYSNEAPTAHEGAVVWRSNDRAGSDPSRAFLWKGSLTDLTSEVDANMSRNYSLYDGTLAYEWGASPAWIVYWDGATTQQVANGYEPSLYAGGIAYVDWDGHDWEIHYWNGSSVLQITDNDYNDTQVSLHNGMVAWVGRPPGSADQIFYARLPR